MIITIDCGTTNLRARLFDGQTLIGEVKHKTGTRLTAFDGNTLRLEASLRDAIRELLDAAGKTERDVEIIVSSGTLASDVGIYKIPHAVAPCGIPESAAAASFARFPEISSVPFLFIPGVKTLPGDDVTDEMQKIEIWDSMSGEECETYGILDLLGIDYDCIVTLPGSYNKYMKISGGKILTLDTGMCGEFIAAMSEHTLLKSALPSPVIQTVIPEKLFQGYDYCSRHGVSPSLIKTRNIQVHGKFTRDEAANFFTGAILYDDIRSVALYYEKERLPVIVGGGDPLRTVFMLLLSHAGVNDLREIDDESCRIASSIGAMKVYAEKLKTHKRPE